jgi:hypothetical protein
MTDAKPNRVRDVCVEWRDTFAQKLDRLDKGVQPVTTSSIEEFKSDLRAWIEKLNKTIDGEDSGHA